MASLQDKLHNRAFAVCKEAEKVSTPTLSNNPLQWWHGRLLPQLLLPATPPHSLLPSGLGPRVPVACLCWAIDWEHGCSSPAN